MQFKVLAVSALLAATASASSAKWTRGRPFGCATPEPTEEQIQVASKFLEQERFSAKLGSLKAQRAFAVDAYFHVVAASESEYITEQQLTDQLAVLNDAYGKHGISFNLVETDFTVNSVWAEDGAELEMKAALRKGSYSALNIYFLTSLGDGTLGYCYFPTEAAEGSDEFIQDGCSVLAQSVPGGDAAPFNLGGTATHEVGHWMNLFHTFQGGCSAVNDQVDDTPSQAGPSSGCPTGADTCPATGVDPIHNYMDYSDDACYEEFTAGQEARMYSAWQQYRG